MLELANVAIATVTSILAIASIIGNSLVCAVVKKNRDMRTPINYLLINLAASDIIFAAFYLPKNIISLGLTQPEGVAGRILCTFLTDGTFAWIGASSSVITLVSIATEHYYSVIYPHGNHRNLTMGKLKIIIPGSWVLSLMLNFPEFRKEVDRNSCVYTWSDWIPKAYFITWFGLVAISFTLMAVLYFRAVYTLWFKRNVDNELTYQQQGVLKIRKRVTLMVLTVNVIFVICWATDTALHLLKDVCPYKISPIAIPIAHTMVMFNAAVNPFTYALISQRFREKIKGMICCLLTPSTLRVHPAREPQSSREATQLSCLPRQFRAELPSDFGNLSFGS